MGTRHDAVPETDEVKIKYMASAHVDWYKFCEEVGLDPSNRNHYPYLHWRDEKRKILAQKQAEELSEMLFDRRFRWHKDVVKTLRDYPETSDIAHQLIRARLQTIVQSLNDDIKKKPVFETNEKTGKKTKVRQTFADTTSTELYTLASAIKQVTESKHRSLLLGDWSAKLAEAETQRESEKDVSEAPGITIEVIGKEGGLAPEDIEQMVRTYIDQAKGS